MSDAAVDHSERQRAKGRSKVSNGKALWTGVDGRSIWARRQRDILAQICSDMGGVDLLSEGQKQLARGAAALSVACEKLEAQMAGASAEATERFTAQAGGLSPHEILHEAGRLLHGIARTRDGDGLQTIAALPDAELDRVTDLLVKAGELAAKAIAAGSETTADLSLYGMLADRCGRTFQRLGLRRQPRDISAYSPLKDRYSQPEADADDGDKEPIDADVSEVAP
jgi:hypothetical protein